MPGVGMMAARPGGAERVGATPMGAVPAEYGPISQVKEEMGRQVDELLKFEASRAPTQLWDACDNLRATVFPRLYRLAASRGHARLEDVQMRRAIEAALSKVPSCKASREKYEERWESLVVMAADTYSCCQGIVAATGNGSFGAQEVPSPVEGQTLEKWLIQVRKVVKRAFAHSVLHHYSAVVHNLLLVAPKCGPVTDELRTTAAMVDEQLKCLLGVGREAAREGGGASQGGAAEVAAPATPDQASLGRRRASRRRLSPEVVAAVKRLRDGQPALEPDEVEEEGASPVDTLLEMIDLLAANYGTTVVGAHPLDKKKHADGKSAGVNAGILKKGASQSSPSPASSAGGERGGSARKVGFPDQFKKCYNCGKMGHTRYNCIDPAPRQGPPGPTGSGL